MSEPSGRERCGRCGLSAVVEATELEKGEEGGGYDPFDGNYIEVDERQLRIASAPGVLAGRAKRWLDATATRLIYGR